MSINLAVVRSITGSIAIKLISSVVALVSVPLLLKTLGTSEYAVWVTSTALVAWLNLFDFGSGYSLKNKVTESLATGEFEELNVLIAGTFQFYICMSVAILLAFICSLYTIDVFKANKVLAMIIYLPIIFSFPLTLGHFIIQGRKKFNTFNLILMSQSMLWLVVVVLFSLSALFIGIWKLAAFYSFFFFLTNLTILIASLKGMDFKWREIFNINNIKASKDSLKVGYRFFLLQVSSLFLFSLGNILTYNHLTLKNVAEYDTINKVYVMGMTLFNVIISVLWAEVSHAKALKDKSALMRLYKQLFLIALGFSLGTALFTLFVPYIIGIWTKQVIRVQLITLVPFAILVTSQSLAYAGAVILNAFEELNVQIYFSIFASILIIPLSNFFFQNHFGIGTVPLASSILIFPSLVFGLIRAKTIITNME